MNILSIDRSTSRHTQDTIDIPSGTYTIKNLRKGEYLYMPNENCDKVYFLQKGRIIIGAFSDEGKIMSKNLVQAKSFFGVTGLAGERLRRNFALAKEETKVWVFELNDLRLLLRKRPELYIQIISSIGKRMINTGRRLESMVFKSSRTRVVEFLYQLGKEEGMRVGYETLVSSFFTHQEIADLTGTSRQTVTTTLNELRNDNLITFNRRRLLIRDLVVLGQAI